MSEARLSVAPIDSRETFKDKAYTALRNVIVRSDIYRSRTDIRLDERQLAQDFGISRTPVREMPKSCASWRSSRRMSVRER